MSLPPNESDDRASHDRQDDPTHATPSQDAASTAPSDHAPPPPVPGGYPPAAQPTNPIPSTGAPVAKRSRATAVLAALAVLLLLALVGMTALFVANRISSDEKIDDQKSQIETLQRDLKAKSDELTKTNGDLDSAKDEAAAAKKQADSAAVCIKAVQDFFKALNANDETAGGRAALVIDRDCEGVDIPFP